MWLCGCLGGQRGHSGAHGVDALVRSQVSEAGPQCHVAASKPSKALTDTEAHDVQHDKDQGDAAQPQLKHAAAHNKQRPSPQRQSGNGPLTPKQAAHLQQQRLQTWSPSHVSLDLPGLQQHASISELQKQERTLRALLDKVHKYSSVMGSGAVGMHAVQRPQQLGDPDITRLNQQILAACCVQRPGPEVHDRVTQLLQQLHSWLSQPSSASAGGAIVLLHGAGEALAHAEHLARSAGQVQFWGTAVVGQLCALLRIYTTMVEQCLASSAAHSASTDVCGKALVDTLVQLLVRPSLIELLAQVLQLVHLDAQFKASTPRHEAVGAAMAALDFLCDVVRLARTHVAAVGEKRLAECLALLAGMLSPPDGLLPRILQRPLSVDNATVQLHTLFLLQQLFESPAEVLRQLLRPAASAASFYLNHHLTEAARCYFASGGDPASACAELCMMHVKLLRSLCRGGAVAVSAGPAAAALVGGPVPAQRVNELLLSELSAEYEASQAAALLASEHEVVERSSSMSSSSNSSTGGCDASDLASAGKLLSSQQEQLQHQAPGRQGPGKAGAATDAKPGKFEFTYDLNEDLARILEMEEKLGEAVEVDGFEYDQEGQQLLQRNSVMAAEAEAADTAAAAGEIVSRPPSLMAPASSRAQAVSDGGRPPVPKLSFSSFSRSALSSSRSLAATPSAAPSAAPSARAGPASPGRPLSTQPSDAVPAVACVSVLDEGMPIPRQLQLHHTPAATLANSCIRAMPPSPPAVHHHVPAHLAPCLARHSPSRLSCVASSGDPATAAPASHGKRISFGSVIAAGGPFAASSLHTVSTPTPTTGVAHPGVPPIPIQALEAGASIEPSSARTAAASARSTAAALPPAPRPAGIPMLDLSGLGSSSKTMRSGGGTGSNSRRGSLSTRVGSAAGSSASRRQIPDSASDAAGKVGAAYRSSACSVPVPAPSATSSSSQLPTQPNGSASARPPSASTAASVGLTPSAPSMANSAAPAGHGLPGAVTVTGDPSQRLLFRDPKLHVNLLSLALEVSTTTSGQLDALFWQQYPLDNGQQYNLEYLLMWHMNNGNGAASAVPELRRRLEATVAHAQAGPTSGPSAAVPAAVASMLASNSQVQARAARAQLRLLKLLSKSLFDSSRYTELKFMARGAYSSVYRAKARLAAPAAATSAAGVQQQQQQVIIKTVALPSSRYDRCVLPDIYGEIAIMDQYQGCPGICQMLDYGLTDDAFWIVMKKYRCSLADWRQRQALGPTSAPAAALYLAILLQVVAGLKALAHDSVVHFDLKCSNVLIDAHPGVKDSDIWNPLASVTGAAPGGKPAAGQAPTPPFDAVLADFGEARSYRNADEAFTVRNRGTEVYKSPEMLLLNTRPTPPVGPGPDAAPPSATAPAAAAKAALQGAGLASDIWSLGCLAYELLSGKVLFGGDYASVTHRVAFGGRGNLTLTATERAALGDRLPLVGLLEWILARDPAERPSLEAIEARVREVQKEVWSSA